MMTCPGLCLQFIGHPPHGITTVSINTIVVAVLCCTRVLEAAKQLEAPWNLQLYLLVIVAAVLTCRRVLEAAKQPEAPWNLQGCILGGDDMAASLGATRTDDNFELQYARQRFVMHCRAFHIQAIDIVRVRRGRGWGHVSGGWGSRFTEGGRGNRGEHRKNRHCPGGHGRGWVKGGGTRAIAHGELIVHQGVRRKVGSGEEIGGWVAGGSRQGRGRRG